MHERLHTWIADHRDEALERLVGLVAVNTHPSNLEGLSAGEALLSDLFSPFGDVSVTPLPDSEVVLDSGTVVARKHGAAVAMRRPGAGPRIMLIGHHDTVFEPDVSFALERGPDRWVGPGVADAKGGLVQVWLALGALDAAGVDADLHLLVVPDEEIGSPGSASLIRSIARDSDLGFGFEPSFPNGDIAGARSGSGNFALVVRGRAAHAGREHHLGRNAVVVASRLALALSELTVRPDVLVNPGVIRGGTAVNIVPDLAVLRLNTRVKTPAQAAAFLDRLGALAEAERTDGIEIAVHGGFGRPPKPLTASYERLLGHVVDIAATIGLSIGVGATGGVCDGNLMADAGLVNVDNLGPMGGNLHQIGEYLEISSLGERALLTALLIAHAEDFQEAEPGA